MISFKLSNIKSFYETDEINMKKINVFVGKNSSGKSSLLRFPVLLSQTFQEEVYTPLLFSGNQIDYGNYDDVKNKKSTHLMNFKLGFNPRILRDGLINSYSLSSLIPRQDGLKAIKTIEKLSVEIYINKHNKKIVVERINLLLNGDIVTSVFRDEKNTYKMEIIWGYKDGTFVNLDHKITLTPEISFARFIPQINLYSGDIFISTFTQINKVENLVNDKFIKDLLDNVPFKEIVNSVTDQGGDFTENQKKFITIANKAILSIVLYDAIFLSIRRELTRYSNEITYIGPFRKDPERIYRDSESSFINVGKNGENASAILRQAQQSKPEVLMNVSEWFEKSMGFSIGIEEIDNSNLFRLMVGSRSADINSNIIDVGYGVSQVLPIVTQVYMDRMQDEEIRRSYQKTSQRKTFIFEQPELHLHPAAQANLADLFVEKVIKHSASKFLIETHSEHLIRKLQVLIADPQCEVKHTDVAFYYVDKAEDGYSSVTKIEINENGQFIEKWPSGFFDKSYELSRELLHVARKRDSN